MDIARLLYDRIEKRTECAQDVPIRDDAEQTSILHHQHMMEAVLARESLQA